MDLLGGVGEKAGNATRTCRTSLFRADRRHAPPLLLAGLYASNGQVIKLYTEMAPRWKNQKDLNVMSESQCDEPVQIEGESSLKRIIQDSLGKEITQISLKGRGACNDAYYVETTDGSRYIVKRERVQKEFQPQNSLLVEAAVARKLFGVGLSVPIPRVALTSEDPAMYGYEYIDGVILKDVWGVLSEVERIDICQKLGNFHAEIGKKITREVSQDLGVKIDESSGLHPEVEKEYIQLMAMGDVPDQFKQLAQRAKEVFERTKDRCIFQFLHNDAHHENILIKDKKIAGIIDFGNAEYGEVAREFSRYIRDFPEHFQYIVVAYEAVSGNQLSYDRLVSNALLSGFMENVEDYRKGGETRLNAERSISHYERLIA